MMVSALPSQFGAAITDASFLKISAAIMPSTTSDAGAWSAWGRLLRVKLARYDEAETAYREAVIRDRNAVWPWIGLGKIQKDLERYDEAESSYRRFEAFDQVSAAGALVRNVDRGVTMETGAGLLREMLARREFLVGEHVRMSTLLAKVRGERVARPDLFQARMLPRGQDAACPGAGTARSLRHAADTPICMALLRFVRLRNLS